MFFTDLGAIVSEMIQVANSSEILEIADIISQQSQTHEAETFRIQGLIQELLGPETSDLDSGEPKTIIKTSEHFKKAQMALDYIELAFYKASCCEVSMLLLYLCQSRLQNLGLEAHDNKLAQKILNSKIYAVTESAARAIDAFFTVQNQIQNAEVHLNGQVEPLLKYQGSLWPQSI